MLSSLQGWGVLCIFLTHTAVYVHAGYKYSFTVVEGHNVDIPIPKHCLDGAFLLNNENYVIAEFHRRLSPRYRSRRGELNDSCFSKNSTRCDFRMKVTSVSESGAYRLYHTSLSDAPYPCDIVYLLEVWPGEHYVVTGKLEGILNGIKLEDLNIVATCDKTCNLSVDSLQRQAGLQITMLLSTDLFELIGWMFAISGNSEVRNGYSLTGGFCQRIANIKFPKRRAVTLIQDFKRTKRNEFRLDTSVNGTVPLKYLFIKNVRHYFNARYTLSIPVQEYEETYKRTGASLIEMTSVRLRPFGNDTLNYTINQAIRFKSPWASTFDAIAHLMPVVLSVTNIRVSYDSTDMQARLKMTPNISLFEDRVLADTKGRKIDLTDDMHRTIDLMPMEIAIPVLLFVMIFSLLLGYVCYCYRKKMQKGVNRRKIGVNGKRKVDHTSTVNERESQVLTEEEAASFQNVYESVATISVETIHNSEVNDELDKQYLTPIFDANTNNVENPEGQTESISHLQTNTLVGNTSDAYEEIASNPGIKCHTLSNTYLKEIVDHISNIYEEIDSHSEIKSNLLSNTNLKEVVGNASDAYEETGGNSEITDNLPSNTNLKELLGNTLNVYEEIDGNTHLKEIAYNTHFQRGSAVIDPNSNTAMICETNLKPEDASIYYYPGFLQDMDTPGIDVTVGNNHEYETVTPTVIGKPYDMVNELSDDSYMYMIPCINDSVKISTGKSEQTESKCEETLVKQIYTSNTDLKGLYNYSYEEIESNRFAQLQFETENNPNFEEQGGYYSSLFNMQSDQESSNQDSFQIEDTLIQGNFTDSDVMSFINDEKEND